jgi:hypothetical protein
MRGGTGWKVNVERARRAAVCVAVAVGCASASAAAAEDGTAAPASRPGDPAAPQALGRVFAAGPTAPAVFLVSSGGYGYTGSVLNTGDTHHRAAGSVAVEGRPVDWLGLALRLDGRYDRSETAQGTDDGWIGDPRVFLRLDHALGAAFRAGARLGVWFPGRAAPSIDLAATTPELSGALTCALPRSPVWLTANAGYRINRSTRTATDASQLSASDRLGLELSAYDQALLGLAAVYGDGRAQGFLELSAELMVGAGSPPASASPLRAGGGMRLAVSRDVRLETQAEVVVGERATLSMSGPLVPVPPRAAFWLGVAYRFGANAGAPPVRHTETPPPAPSPAPPAPAVVATIDGHVVAGDGAPLNALHVTVQTAGDGDAVKVDADGEGRFTFTGKPGQTLLVRAEAADYEPATESVTLAEGASLTVTLTLRRRLPGGQIRGLIRSFKGDGLDAEIKIEPGDRTLHTESGRFEADVSPGTYDVTITAQGYETQRRHVEVERNGVTLLNADLRRAR